MIFIVSESPYQYDWNTVELEDDEYIIKVISYDTSDNFTESQPIMLIVDNIQEDVTPPSVTITFSTEGSVSEIMYKPEGGAQYEFIELFNAGTSTINLKGFRFPQGQPFDEFVFGDVEMQAGSYLLVVNDIEIPDSWVD